MTDKTGAGFVIRRYDPGDRPALEALYNDFEPKGAAQGLPPRHTAAIRQWLDRVLGQGEHLVVEADGWIVGHAMLIPMDDGGAELANFLHQSLRSRGIGTALARVSVDLARDVGYRRVWLSVEPGNRAAVRSYRKAGFHVLPGSPWAPEIEMEVPLEAAPLAS